jgi:hypothetical protein
MRNIILTLAACLVAAAGGFIVGHSSGLKDPRPVRPSNVASDAVWAGGPDGGMWIRCNAGVDRALICSVAANVTGELVESGQYEVDLATATPFFYTSSEIDFRVRAKKRK